jgi:hypothetical protein
MFTVGPSPANGRPGPAGASSSRHFEIRTPRLHSARATEARRPDWRTARASGKFATRTGRSHRPCCQPADADEIRNLRRDEVILQIDRRPIQSTLHIARKTRQTAPRTDQSHTAAIVPCVAKFAGTFAAAQFVCRQSKLFFCLLVHVVPFRCEAKARVPHSASAGEDLPSGVFLRSHERPSFTKQMSEDPARRRTSSRFRPAHRTIGMAA